MWTIIRRAIVPMLLIVGGVASVIHGARHHSEPVLEEQEREIRIGPPPEAFDPGLPPGVPGVGGFPPGVPRPPLPFPTTVIEKILVATDTSEPRLIREVTFGGVVLLASGQLKRTYSGKPPSLCPT